MNNNNGTGIFGFDDNLGGGMNEGWWRIVDGKNSLNCYSTIQECSSGYFLPPLPTLHFLYLGRLLDIFLFEHRLCNPYTIRTRAISCKEKTLMLSFSNHQT